MFGEREREKTPFTFLQRPYAENALARLVVREHLLPIVSWIKFPQSLLRFGKRSPHFKAKGRRGYLGAIRTHVTESPFEPCVFAFGPKGEDMPRFVKGRRKGINRAQPRAQNRSRLQRRAPLGRRRAVRRVRRAVQRRQLDRLCVLFSIILGKMAPIFFFFFPLICILFYFFFFSLLKHTHTHVFFPVSVFRKVARRRCAGALTKSALASSAACAPARERRRTYVSFSKEQVGRFFQWPIFGHSIESSTTILKQRLRPCHFRRLSTLVSKARL